jgi:hypothetical protein
MVGKWISLWCIVDDTATSVGARLVKRKKRTTRISLLVRSIFFIDDKQRYTIVSC